jgi:hypothetical protein
MSILKKYWKGFKEICKDIHFSDKIDYSNYVISAQEKDRFLAELPDRLFYDEQGFLRCRLNEEEKRKGYLGLVMEQKSKHTLAPREALFAENLGFQVPSNGNGTIKDIPTLLKKYSDTMKA